MKKLILTLALASTPAMAGRATADQMDARCAAWAGMANLSNQAQVRHLEAASARLDDDVKAYNMGFAEGYIMAVSLMAKVEPDAVAMEMYKRHCIGKI